MSSGAEYVIAAYGVVAFALIVYLVVAAMKRARLGREQELLDRLDDRAAQDDAPLAESKDTAGAAEEAPRLDTVDR